MRSRASWAGAAPTAAVLALVLVPAVVVAVVVDEAAGLLGFVALVLAGAAVLHGVRPRSLPGSPAQNVGRVVVVAAAALGLLLLLGVAFVTWLLSGLCGSECDDRPWRGAGVLVALAFVAAAVVVVAGGAWLWTRLGRSRDPARRTPRGLTLLPAAAVGLVALVSAVAAPGDPQRPRPDGRARVLWSPCQGVGAGRECGIAEGLRTATSGSSLLAVWRTGPDLVGVLSGPGAPRRPIPIATIPGEVDGRPGGSAAAAAPDGGFVVAWTAGSELLLARVSAAGETRRVPGVRPGPTAPGTAVDGGRAPVRELALTATARGWVAFAVGRIPDRTGVSDAGGPASRTALRVLALDAELRPRGPWRTVSGAVPFALGDAATTADGRAAVGVGTGAVRTAVSVPAAGGAARVQDDRLLVPGPGGARVEPLPGPRELPDGRGPSVGRDRPQLDGAVRDVRGLLRSSWTVRAPRSDAVPARVRQQWVLGPGAGTPERPLTEGLLESRPVRTSAGPVLVGLRPTGTRRSDDVEVVLVPIPR